MQVAKAVLDGAKAGSLVLMDEMGSGTDPMQGAALAQSLLEVINVTATEMCIILTWPRPPSATMRAAGVVYTSNRSRSG